MVKLLSVIFLNQPGDRPPVIIASAFYLESFGFFEKGSVREFCIFSSRECTKRCDGGTSNVIQHKGYRVFVRKFLSGLTIACVADIEYPNNCASGFMNKCVTLFHEKYPNENTYLNIAKDTNLDVPRLESTLFDCQNPKNADQITAIQKDLEETKAIVEKNIEALFQRGEKLEDLIEKSEDLSFQSKLMLEKAEEMNSSCCVLF